MSAQHTPGPWFVENDETNYKHDTDPNRPSIRSNAESEGVWFIARIEEGCPNPHENANLIAAAPDLLEALENLENDDNSIPSHAWDMVQSAIAKAKGETK